MKRELLKYAAVLTLMLIGVTLSAQTITKGKASYYANKFHGRPTSSGDIYHRDSLTCAHRTLPFGTRLKVRNPRNGREVIVEVNDRGPFCEGRIVDLSYAAAKKIGLLHSGVARVEVEKVLPFSLQKVEEFTLPELFITHPISGETYTFKQWAQCERTGKEKTNISSYKTREGKQLTKTATPLRWHVNNQQITAQAKKKPSTQKK